MLFECCVDSVDGAVAAEQGGADRVELCAALIEGGLTPSAGSIAFARERLKIPIHVMIRPRGGDFLYSTSELEVMRRDIDTAKRLKADGVVLGVLDADGRIAGERTRELTERARPLSVTFHRAFDMASDPRLALEELIAVGVDRVLTSGQETSRRMKGWRPLRASFSRRRVASLSFPAAAFTSGRSRRSSAARACGKCMSRRSVRSTVE